LKKTINCAGCGSDAPPALDIDTIRAASGLPDIPQAWMEDGKIACCNLDSCMEQFFAAWDIMGHAFAQVEADLRSKDKSVH
jgi:hypothetical protein